MPLAQDLLETQNLTKRFGGVTALDDVSIALRRGEILCLAGENGSGKSTWIKIAAGVLEPDGGRVLVDGKPRLRASALQAIEQGIQVIYQDLSLFPNLSVAENIALPAFVRDRRALFRPKLAERIAREALERIGVSIDPRARAGELSLGARQLVAIARALARDARAIIMDEPTSALTYREVDSLLGVLRDLRARGVSIVFVSHRLSEVLEVSDRIVVLRNGRVAGEGPAAEFDRARLAELMTGRASAAATEAVAPHPPPGALSPGAAPAPQAIATRSAPRDRPLLRAERLSKANRFSDVSFDLFPGEIVGFAGLLGSGRTAVALALFGLEPADSGRAWVDGIPVRLQSPRDALEAGIAYVPKDRLREGLFLDQSVERNIAAGILDRLAGALGFLAPRRIREEATTWIRGLAIRAASPRARARELSGGNQQKTVLAKGLATRARILLLDRPSAGVDVGAREDIQERIRELARSGRGCVLISDEASELAALSDRIVLFHRGRVVRELPGGPASEGPLLERLKELR